MSVERKQIQHYHTTNSEAIPVASDLLNGEIALNINKGNEKIFIKNSEGNISSFRGEQYYEENFLHKNDTAQSAIDLTGRIEATPEAFTYRPSAGDKSIRDDSAIIKRIKGNTIIWNQQNPDPKLNSSTLRITGKDMGVVNGFRRLESEDGSATLLQMRVASSPYSIKEHIYLVTFRAKTDDSSITFYTNGAFLKDLTMAVSADTIVYGEYITTGRAANYIIPSIKAQNATYLEATDLQIYDLTQMFGAGNEPSTVDEFKALFPNGNYEYNTGEIRSLNVNRIKTTGFNQWDEKWELGLYSESLGTKSSSTDTIRNVNRIQVLPDTDYNIKHPKASNLLAYVHYYDFDGNYLYREDVNSRVFTTPSNCQYINFFMTAAYGNVYKNDICINLSHTGYLNGEYEPYKEFTRELDVIKKYFPDGMKSVGTVYDEITATKVIKRIKVVKLKDLTWTSPTADLLSKSIFNAKISDMRPRGESENETTYCKSILCSKYGIASNTSMGDSLTDKSIFRQGSAYGIVIRDTKYTTIADFVASMTDDDVVYYELAEPIKMEFDEVVDLTYNVYDFGTEEIFSSVPTAPFKADIVYQFNATDTIRQNKNNINRLSREIDRLNGTKYINIVNITYDELIETRNSGSLIPGMWYRITDYVTTTSQANTQSAGHQFNVIVTAVDESTLNENALAAIQYDGDTYFTENGANLDAWQIKYTLDNDTNKFAWADTTNGKGVIYYMKDEYNNECPYDFKNIQFKHPNDTTTYPGYYYTFSTVIDGVVSDHSMLQGYCYDNIMKESISSEKQSLNNNVFLNTSKFSICYSNSFGNNCQNNTFGNDCYNNSFGNGCYNNSFGTLCSNNSFGNDCEYNSFGDNCGYNSFGNNCQSNSFGESCSNNSFGNKCSRNSFGESCSNNSFGYSCRINSFGNYCHSNSFGESCYNNSFGNNCGYNSFGNGCNRNSFGNSASKTGTLKDYCMYNHFDDGCSYNVIWNSDTTSTTIKLKNVNINRGVCGTSSSYNYINIETLNQDYEIQVAKNSNGEIKIYCEADLIS